MIRKENVNIIYNNITEVEFTKVLLMHHILKRLQIHLRYVEKEFAICIWVTCLSLPSPVLFEHLNDSMANKWLYIFDFVFTIKH